jgi:hypothetical protein
MSVSLRSWVLRWRMALAVCALGALTLLAAPGLGRADDDPPGPPGGRGPRAPGKAQQTEIDRLEALLDKQKAEFDETARKLRAALAKAEKEKAEKEKVDEFYDLTFRVPDANRLPITRITIQHTRNLKPDARNKDDKKKEYADLYTIEGTLVDKDRTALDQFADQFRAARGYLVQPPEIKGNKFTLLIYAGRRTTDDEKDKAEQESPRGPSGPRGPGPGPGRPSGPPGLRGSPDANQPASQRGNADLERRLDTLLEELQQLRRDLKSRDNPPNEPGPAPGGPGGRFGGGGRGGFGGFGGPGGRGFGPGGDPPQGPRTPPGDAPRRDQ